MLRPGGRLAAWWSQPRADGEAWFDAYFDLVETIPGLDRRQRDGDPQLPWPMARTDVPWVRSVTAERWLEDERSKSYMAALPDDERRRMLDGIAALLPGDVFDVRYTTTVFVGGP